MYGARFWERLWRSAGIQFVGLFIIASIVYGDQPKVGSSADDLVSFYDGDSTRILIASFIFGLALLNLLWFGTALRSALNDAGQGGWGAAATASSAALAGVLFVLTTIGAALSYSIAGSGNVFLTSGLNDVVWAGFVMASFPAAMFVMSGAFGLWRARVISNRFFGVGIGAVVLVLLGGTTWASSGFWAPDGAYSRFISPAIALVWVAVISGLLTRATSTAAEAEGTAA
jgi:succinate dehydrogenase/fumarate reductase cytochrome b subunit